MKKGGRKYRLLFYEYMLNRWWPISLWIAVFIFSNVGALWGAEWYFKPAENPLPVLSFSGGLVMLAVGAISFFFTLFLLIIRKLAYVQLFDDHLRLVTPFLRLNVSYKRVQRSTTTRMIELFPPKNLSGAKLKFVEPVLGDTVVVIYLTSYPLPRASLGLFLSPYFFYDNTPHFVLMIKDWMNFSMELDSRRTMGKSAWRPPLKSPHGSIGLLDDLKRK